MNIPNLLFSPYGRIGVRDFWRGAILLTGFMIVAQVIETFAPPILSGMFSMLTLGTLYCYLCVYGKRLHDGGRSAWYFLLFLAGFLIFSNILNGILLLIFAPEAAEITREMWYLIQRGESEEAWGHLSEVNRMTIIPRMITVIAVNALLAYAGAKFRSDPNRNPYGEPTGSGDVF